MAKKITLGDTAAYSDTYDASLLVPISRATARNQLAGAKHLQAMQGSDIWQAYEVS
ncbi:MAG: NADPH-dependent 7-cyano-7-deazaguanine reductase QueF, partial [Cellvibrionaceae bacterium]|nr:NADPH-dependent 7-cyano-7-deazaguanine reductase QueF [Cellvibrionaceae bacterium]